MQSSEPSSSGNSRHESDFTSPLNEDPGSKLDDVACFHESLQGLKDLRSQLHYAADYCETTFMNTKEKKMVMDNTKEYICRAVVTVVDHLGSVSEHLNRRISMNNDVSESALRMDCLKQRLLTCQQYAQKLALTKVRCNDNFPQFHSRYISKPTAKLEQVGILRDGVESVTPKTAIPYKTDDGQKRNLHEPFSTMLFAFGSDIKKSRTGSVSGFNFLTSLPRRQGLSLHLKPWMRPFNIQDTKRLGGSTEKKQRSQITRGTKRAQYSKETK